MSLRDQVTAFSKRGAARRQSIYGTPFTYGGKPFCGSFSAITSSRDLEIGGWRTSINAVVRVDRAAYPDFVPVTGKLLTRTETEKRYEISEIKDNPRAPEWVFGVINPELAT